MMEKQSNTEKKGINKMSNKGRADAETMFCWPWNALGNFKYLLYGPFVAKFLHSWIYDERSQGSEWCMHVLILCALRCLIYQLWGSYNASLFTNRTRRVSHLGLDFNQIDSEWHWDNFIILQALVASIAYLNIPMFANLDLWNTKGIIFCLLLHVCVSEPLFYWLHKQLHSPDLFLRYHWLHHSSRVLHPFSAGHASFLEHLLLCVIVGIPIIGTILAGYGSISMVYGYVLVFDFLRSLMHCNVEVIPHSPFEAFPVLKYLISTPTYHSLHHEEMGTNFCLFMPLYDTLGKTENRKSWDHHKEIRSRTDKSARAPDFVFLAHIVDIISSMHAPFIFRSFSTMPFKTMPFLIPLWPFALLFMFAMWLVSKTFLVSFYNLRGRLFQTWAVPRFGFQYFIPFAFEGINKQIEQAILRADRIGVKVISLAALNKNEALNGGGTLFVNKYPNLKVRVVHGNTLTAAVTLNEIPRDVEEVFLTGATSKLGRAISLYLARKRVRVMMLTSSHERFTKIQREAEPEHQKFLIQVTKYQAAKNCKTWIIGKWATFREQSWAPPGTHFHQFVVPSIIPFRRDCTFGKLAAIRFPDDVEGLATCEYTLKRGVVHACHAGGIIHLLEGWSHHEVGTVDVDQIDVVWEAALRHGFKPV